VTVAWSAIQAAITMFVQSTGVVDGDHVLWDREAAKLVLHESSVELRISGERSIGHDDVEEVEVEPGVYSPRITGLREFTLSIQFRARSPVDAYAARDSLETIRASFHHPVRREILNAAGVAFLETEMLETRDVTYQGRWEQIAALDVRLSVLSSLYEPTETVDRVLQVSVSDRGAEPFLIPE
jgi:hypothetical protein